MYSVPEKKNHYQTWSEKYSDESRAAKTTLLSAFAYTWTIFFLGSYETRVGKKSNRRHLGAKVSKSQAQGSQSRESQGFSASESQSQSHRVTELQRHRVGIETRDLRPLRRACSQPLYGETSAALCNPAHLQAPAYLGSWGRIKNRHRQPCIQMHNDIYAVFVPPAKAWDRLDHPRGSSFMGLTAGTQEQRKLRNGTSRLQRPWRRSRP